MGKGFWRGLTPTIGYGSLSNKEGDLRSQMKTGMKIEPNIKKKPKVTSAPTASIAAAPIPHYRNMRRTVRESADFESWLISCAKEEGRTNLKFYLYIHPADLAGIYDVVRQGLIPEDLRSASEILAFLAQRGAQALAVTQ